MSSRLVRALQRQEVASPPAPDRGADSPDAHCPRADRWRTKYFERWIVNVVPSPLEQVLSAD